MTPPRPTRRRTYAASLALALCAAAPRAEAAPFWRRGPSAVAPASAPPPPAGGGRPLLRDWIRARCGPSGQAVWAFRGALYDPLNGNRIATVQGLELVRCLAEVDAAPDGADPRPSREAYRRHCGDRLAAPRAVADPAAVLDYAGTLHSRRLFCYSRVDEEGDTRYDSGGPPNGGGEGGHHDHQHHREELLLERVRLRPGGPLATVPHDQAATVYETATTYVQRGRDWVVHTEWPDGRAVGTTARIETTVEGGGEEAEDSLGGGGGGGDDHRTGPFTRSIEFTSYARPQAKGRLRLPDLTVPPTPPSSDASAQPSTRRTSSLLPKRSALIQFGTSKAEVLSKFGARETYLYRIHYRPRVRLFARSGGADDNADIGACTVRYTRYGEAPLWYGPGRLCTLELTGRRVTDMRQLPSLVAELAADRVVGDGGGFPTAAAVDSDLGHDPLTQRCIDWFRGKGRSGPVRLLAPESTEDDESASKWCRLRRQMEESTTSLWHRLKASTSWTPDR